MSPLTVVVLHWNQPEACERTIEAFLASPVVEDLIVVDNGSESAARDAVRSIADGDPRVDMIEVGYNSGFGPGINRGWELWQAQRTTPWCAVAPHDAMPEHGTLAELVAAGERHGLGLVSADVGDGQAPLVDHVFGPIGRPFRRSAGLEPVDYPHGTLMIASRACLDAVGLFDERYFAYCEEADLGLRAARAGFATGLVVGARVHNPQVNTPTPIVDYLKERNTVLLVASHFGRRKAAMRFALTLAQFVRGVVQPSSRGDYWSTRARALAIVDIIARRWGPPPERVRRLSR